MGDANMRLALQELSANTGRLKGIPVLQKDDASAILPRCRGGTSHLIPVEKKNVNCL